MTKSAARTRRCSRKVGKPRKSPAPVPAPAPAATTHPSTNPPQTSGTKPRNQTHRSIDPLTQNPTSDPNTLARARARAATPQRRRLRRPAYLIPRPKFSPTQRRQHGTAHLHLHRHTASQPHQRQRTATSNLPDRRYSYVRYPPSSSLRLASPLSRPEPSRVVYTTKSQTYLTTKQKKLLHTTHL
jgi:hypothetical protein